MYILGAGLSGCMAGFVFPEAHILEAGRSKDVNHKALLRFRTDAISVMTGIKFKKVKVYKSIWSNGAEHSVATPSMIISYANKVTGVVADRSISTTRGKPVIRYIAPKDFLFQMRRILDSRITYGTRADKEFITNDDEDYIEPIISTIPMNIMAKILGQNDPTVNKSGVGARNTVNSISVFRGTLSECDFYATIYFPDVETDMYRASITGDELIIESTSVISTDDIESILNRFSLDSNRVMHYEVADQPFGKLSPVSDKERRQFIFQNTVDHKIYSLGRFAIWRNVLLDDVLLDAYHIRDIINRDYYEYLKHENKIT